MPTEITVNPAALVAMLTDLAVIADADETVPMLSSINLHLDSRDGNIILVGSSTDRFAFGQAHVAATGAGGPVFLELDFVDRVTDADHVGPAWRTSPSAEAGAA
jgi:hypothetical protein